MKKIFALIAALTLVALVGPAQAAKSPHPPKPPHPTTSHNCTPHKVGYVAAGTLVSGLLTKESDGTYSGTLTVHVTRTNHHARGDKGTDKAYTLDHAKANLHGEDPGALVVDSRVHVKGTITKLSKKCDQTGFTSTLVIKRVSIKPPLA